MVIEYLNSREAGYFTNSDWYTVEGAFLVISKYGQLYYVPLVTIREFTDPPPTKEEYEANQARLQEEAAAQSRTDEVQQEAGG